MQVFGNTKNTYILILYSTIILKKNLKALKKYMFIQNHVFETIGLYYTRQWHL